MQPNVILAATLALAIILPGAVSSQETPSKPARVVRAATAPPEMERLDFLIGTWLNSAVFLDRQGNEVGRFDAATDLPGGSGGMTIEPALGGWILESGAGSPYGRAWFRYEPLRGVYMLAAADFQGNFDVLTGEFRGDELVFTEIAPKPHRDGGTIMWRWTYYDIGGDAFRMRQEFSRDAGASWVLSNRQLNRRLNGA